MLVLVNIITKELRDNSEVKDFKRMLGVVLQQKRKDHTTLSQSEMGKKLGMTQKGISNIESGVTLANAYVLYKYCEICGINPNEVFDSLKRK